MALIHLDPVRGALAVLGLAATSLTAAAPAPQSGCVSETFSALAVNRSNDAVLLSSEVTIQVRRWSSESEKTRFARTLLNEGPRSLLGALQRVDTIGDIRTPYTFPYAIRFAWQEPLEGDGRRIVLITDSTVMIWKDAMRLGPGHDAFTVIELRIPYDDDGEGKVAVDANIHANRSLDLIELEDYSASPVRLVGVRTRWTPTTVNRDGDPLWPPSPVFSVR